MPCKSNKHTFIEKCDTVEKSYRDFRGYRKVISTILYRTLLYECMAKLRTFIETFALEGN